MARQRDPQTGRLMMEGIRATVSERTGVVTYRARFAYYDYWGNRKFPNKTFKSYEAAESFLLETQLAIRKGTYQEPSKITMGEYWEVWLERKRASWKGATIYHAKRHWEVHLKHRLAHLLITDMSRTVCQRLIDELIADGLKPQSARVVMHHVSGMLRSAAREKLIASNPATDLEYPAIHTEKKKVWSSLQLRRFLEGTRGTKYHLLWVILASTGCRISEALAIKWGDVDRRAGTVHFGHALVYTEDGRLAVREGTKTLEQGHTVALEPYLLDLLPAHPDPDAYVFDHKGEPPAFRLVRSAFNEECDRLDITRITLHGFRHTAATLMFANNVPERVIQEVLGHGSIRTTMDQYTHVNVETQRIGTRALTQLLTDAPNTTTSLEKPQ